MLNDFTALDYPGHELSAVTERWCYDCYVYINLDTVAKHEGHDINTTVKRYCYNCDEMHVPEQADFW